MKLRTNVTPSVTLPMAGRQVLFDERAIDANCLE
jgi:hypothetical protein